MDSFYKNFVSIFTAIDLNLEKKLILPALMLIYSAIDIVGGLERKKENINLISIVPFSLKNLPTPFISHPGITESDSARNDRKIHII